jgi:hypothetical protein
VNERGELEHARVVHVGDQDLESRDDHVDVRRRLTELRARECDPHRPQPLDGAGARELRAERPADIEHEKSILLSAGAGQRP